MDKRKDCDGEWNEASRNNSCRRASGEAAGRILRRALRQARENARNDDFQIESLAGCAGAEARIFSGGLQQVLAVAVKFPPIGVKDADTEVEIQLPLLQHGPLHPSIAQALDVP